VTATGLDDGAGFTCTLMGIDFNFTAAELTTALLEKLTAELRDYSEGIEVPGWIAAGSNLLHVAALAALERRRPVSDGAGASRAPRTSRRDSQPAAKR
jgi:hypothetical protein